MAKNVSQLISVRPAFQVRRGAVKCESGLATRYVASAIFDTAAKDSAGVSNKTVAAHGLGVFIPTKAVITNAWTDVLTAFTSATGAATIALMAQGAGDLVVGIAINSGSSRWGSGLGGCLPGAPIEGTVSGDSGLLSAARNAATYIKMTAERELTATVGVEALTAGKMVLFIEYTISA